MKKTKEEKVEYKRKKNVIKAITKAQHRHRPLDILGIANNDPLMTSEILKNMVEIDRVLDDQIWALEAFYKLAVMGPNETRQKTLEYLKQFKWDAQPYIFPPYQNALKHNLLGTKWALAEAATYYSVSKKELDRLLQQHANIPCALLYEYEGKERYVTEKHPELERIMRVAEDIRTIDDTIDTIRKRHEQANR